MNNSTLDLVPREKTARGTGSNAELHWTAPPTWSPHGQAVARASQPGYVDWLHHVQAAAGCTRPIRLTGRLDTIEAATGRLLDARHTDQLPDAAIYKACGNRRHTVCPSCARTYQRDAYQLLRAGLIGGKGVPATVSTHPAAFVTLTAPGFGTVHTRHIRKHTCTDRKRCQCRPEPCHARRATGLCDHGQPAVCWTRHTADDPALGQPLCLDCYDHNHHVVFNLFAAELWHRTKQDAERRLAKLCRARGIPFVEVPAGKDKVRRVSPVRLSHGKAAEMQRRGAIHFHTLVRLDGVDPNDPTAVIPPPAGIGMADLVDAFQQAVRTISFATPAHPDRPDGWHIRWGDPDKGIDIRPITLSGAGDITDSMVAGYLAKYATKSTEATGYQSTRITADTDQQINPEGDHTARLVAACWNLGRPSADRQPSLDTKPPRPADPSPVYTRLRRWAHMLGYGGHFLTKARRYSITFKLLRDTRVTYRRAPDAPPTDAGTVRAADHQAAETTLIVGTLTFSGVGWHTTGDALLANTAAAMARARRDTGREELAHEAGSDLAHTPQAA